jgi:metal-responsive CopG/Arc/MetJ family transcriptional regulator
MARTSVKIDKALYNRIKKCAEVAGYSSPEEFIEHVLEKEMEKLEDADSDEEIARRLQGLGYID